MKPKPKAEQWRTEVEKTEESTSPFLGEEEDEYESEVSWGDF